LLRNVLWQAQCPYQEHRHLRPIQELHKIVGKGKNKAHGIARARAPSILTSPPEATIMSTSSCRLPKSGIVENERGFVLLHELNDALAAQGWA
jgi:hypothetical protein